MTTQAKPELDVQETLYAILGELEKLRQNMDQRFAAMDQRFDQLDAKVDALTEAHGELRRAFDEHRH